MMMKMIQRRREEKREKMKFLAFSDSTHGCMVSSKNSLCNDIGKHART